MLPVSKHIQPPFTEILKMTFECGKEKTLEAKGTLADGCKIARTLTDRRGSTHIQRHNMIAQGLPHQMPPQQIALAAREGRMLSSPIQSRRR